MPKRNHLADMVPLEQRTTEELEKRFDHLTRSSMVVRHAIECMCILQEFARREALAEEQKKVAQSLRSPQPAAGDNKADAAAKDGTKEEATHGAAG
jgi:uncharacterized protein (DUF1697 family)